MILLSVQLIFLHLSPDAADAADIVQLTTNLTFMSSAHEQTHLILFRIIDDNLVELPEEFFISVGSVTATITITDNDGELMIMGTYTLLCQLCDNWWQSIFFAWSYRTG